jgi:uncharacterized protein DUF2786
MGSDSRQWSKHKRRRRSQARAGFDDGFGDEELPLALGDVIVAAAAAAERATLELDVLVDDLARRAGRRGDAGAREVSAALVHQLRKVVGECWEHGWQPADVVHVVARRHKAVHRELCAAVVAVDAGSYRHHPQADGGWLAQVDAVTEGVAVVGDEDLLGRWAPRAGDLRAALLVAVETLGVLLFLPRQPILVPPPSQWGASGAVAGGVASGWAASAADPKVIERVRALLAKAESTDFPEEAEAFTAKAQELIARHAIDRAMLRGEQTRDGSGARAQATSRRVLVDDPYGRAKSLLLGVVADANRCTAVWDAKLSIATVFGSLADLDAVELLYTSLLTQATAAMVHAGRGGSRSRSRSFRSSFLVAYASRIGERLQQATQAAVTEAEAEHGTGVLPVLASQQAAAEEARDEAFPRLRHHRITTRNPAGWLAGRAAADRARLGPDTALPAR